MGFCGFVKPRNKIVVAGNPLVQELNIEEAGMYPGMLVMKGTNDDDIKINTDPSNNVVGWLGYEHTNPAYRPKDVDTSYNVGDKAAVLFGSNFVIVTSAIEAISKGEILEPSGNGDVRKRTAVADADGSGNAYPNLKVAIAEETKTAGKADIMVRSKI